MSRRVLASLATAVLLFGITSGTATGVDQPDTAGTIALSSLSPTLITGATRPLDLAGSITNTTTQPWAGVRVEVRSANRILTTRSDLATWITSSSPASGAPVASLDLGDLAAGATRIWQASISAATLSTLATRDGVLALDIRVVDSDGNTLAQQRTAVPTLVSADTPTPTPVVLVVPLTWVPDRVAAGQFLSDRLMRDVATGGRLARALEAGSRANLATPRVRLTYLVDASLMAAVADLADGAQIRVAGQWQAITVEQQQQAQQWLDRAQQVLATHDVAALPYAATDIDAALRYGNRVSALGAIERGARETAQFLTRPAVRSTVWLGASASEDTLPVLSSAQVSTVIVSADAVPATTETFYTPSGSTDLAVGSSGSLRATLLEPTLSARWQQAAATPSQVHDDLALLSDLLLTTLQLPTTARTQVLSLSLAGPEGVAITDTVAAFQDASLFVTTIRLTSALAQPAGSTPRQGLATSTEGQAILPTRYLASITALRERMRVVLTVAKEPVQAQAISDAVLAGLDSASSLTLRGSSRDRVSLRDGIAEILNGYETGISVISGRRLALSGERGVMPLTVRNDLPFTVQVQLRLVPSSPARFRVEDVLEPLVVQPGERASLQIPVQVLGTDPVTVTARLVTSDGSGIGVPATIEIRTAAYARVATYVVAGAFLLLLLLIVRNAVRRTRTRRERPST